MVLQALANLRLGSIHLMQGDYRRAVNDLGQAVAFFNGARCHERFGLPNLPAVLSREYLARCHAELGTFAEGKAFADEGLRIAEAVGHSSSLLVAYEGLGLLALRQGELPKAIALLERGIGICQTGDLPAYFSRIAAALGEAYTP